MLPCLPPEILLFHTFDFAMSKAFSVHDVIHCFFVIILHSYVRVRALRAGFLVLWFRIRYSVLFWPLDPGSGIDFSRSRIPNPYFKEPNDKCFGKRTLIICQLSQIFLWTCSKLNFFSFCKICGDKKRQLNFSPPIKHLVETRIFLSHFCENVRENHFREISYENAEN